jgi:UTP-glucose-1-phosphate uridylyltransferase
VKQATARSNWIWGAFKMPGAIFASLYRLWSEERQCSDIYIGTLVNAYIGAGGSARAVCAGEAYFDVGTLTGYREAISLLSQRTSAPPSTAREALK